MLALLTIMVAPLLAMLAQVTDVTPTLPIDQWVLVCGFLTTIITAILVQVYWPPALKAIVCFLVALVIATGNLWLQGRFAAGPPVSPADWFFYGLTVFVVAIPIYQGLLKPLGIKYVEAATSVDQPRAQAHMAQLRAIGQDK